MRGPRSLDLDLFFLQFSIRDASPFSFRYLGQAQRFSFGTSPSTCHTKNRRGGSGHGKGKGKGKRGRGRGPREERKPSKTHTLVIINPRYRYNQHKKIPNHIIRTHDDAGNRPHGGTPPPPPFTTTASLRYGSSHHHVRREGGRLLDLSIRTNMYIDR